MKNFHRRLPVKTKTTTTTIRASTETMMATAELLTCMNKGCLVKEYRMSENHETACVYHPKGPVFHEGLKGWACCDKRVTDFNDFLAIPGCTRGPHCSVAQVEEAAAETKTVEEKGDEGAAVDAALVMKKDEKSGVETYGMAVETCTAAPTKTPPKTAKAHKVKEPVISEENCHDPLDAILTPGMICQRPGCKALYSTELEPRKDDECSFHTGIPVFHEGSKGWSCCPKRKVLEFEEFLKIKGCHTGRHRFIKVDKANEVRSDILAESKYIA